MTNIFLWISWNPQKTAFTLPYFNLDIAWYGVFFAAGFLLAYLMIIPLFKQFIWQTHKISERDIEDWNKIFTILKNPSNSKISSLADNLRKNSFPLFDNTTPESTTVPTIDLQKKFFSSFNESMNNPQSGFSRKEAELLFPGGIRPANSIAGQAADKLMLYAILGTVVGARLGHVLFYDFDMLLNDPMEILMLRHGGLASHGGTVGVMLAIVFYIRNTRTLLPGLSFVSLMDIMVIPTAIVACCIRIGNFINQEILGTKSSLPWAVIFGHPADRSLPTPRHPAQLYEAALYAATFFFLFAIWLRWKGSLKTGFISGIFFILVFGGRFLIEFLKEPQGGIVDESFLQIGQYLSIPFVIMGAYLAFFYQRKRT